MNISQIAFQYRKVVFILLIGFLIFGGVSYLTLPAQEDPEITIREATVITRYPGLNPVRVEQLITQPIEERIREMSEVEEIRSTSLTGQSIIHVEFYDRYFNLKDMFQTLRNKVDDAQSELPEGTFPSVVNDERGDVSMITLALTADGFDMGEMREIAEHTRDVLYSVKGTKRIELLGIQEEQIFLETSNVKLSQLGISPKALMAILQEQNIIRPGGVVDTGSRSFVIEPTGNFETVQSIADTLIPIPDSQDTIALKDISNVRRGFVDPPRQLCYFNGEPAIMFAISMLATENTLEFSPRMLKVIQQVEQTLPIGYQLHVATYQADQVTKTVNNVSVSVLQTLCIVLVVVILFLGVRTGLIVGAIVPIVMLVTLALMNLFGLSLERMSLATLIISLGLLVDNGIVIAEDFQRRLGEGNSRDDALRGCGKELAFPLLSSSLTTILFFMPLMLAEHVAGEYTRSISIVIFMSLLSSWVLALCVTPTLCHAFLKNPEKPSGSDEEQTGIMYRVYNRFLQIILRFRIAFIALMIGLLYGSMSLFSYVPQEFFPNSDREQLLVYVDMPADNSSRRTDERMRDVFAWLQNEEAFPYIDSFAGYVGFGGPRFVLSLSPEDPADNIGFLVLNITDVEIMDQAIDELRTGFVETFPNMLVRVSRMFLGPSDSSKLEVQVKGPDADFIYAKAQEIKRLMRQIPYTIDIRDNWQNRIVNVDVQIDQQRARRSGISSADVARDLQGFYEGVKVSEFREEDTILPIVVRADSENRFNLDRMRSINIYSESRNTFVPLYQIADFGPDISFSRIQRENLFRTVTVEGKNLSMTAEDMKILLDPKLEELKKDMPVNHHIEYDGVIAESVDAQQALGANLPLVLGIIVVLLVMQFNSYRRPIIILATIPFCLIGVVVGMLLTSSSFGFMVTLGLYSLAGIILNNGIVLIDRMDLERASGKPIHQAIVDSCTVRLRPILMTTVTTVLGLLPLIISRDPMFYGMANAMAFGLAVGTVLSLGVVPVLYSLLFRDGGESKSS